MVLTGRFRTTASSTRTHCTAPRGRLLRITMQHTLLVRGALELRRLIPGPWLLTITDAGRIGRDVEWDLEMRWVMVG